MLQEWNQKNISNKTHLTTNTSRIKRVPPLQIKSSEFQDNNNREKYWKSSVRGNFHEAPLARSNQPKIPSTEEVKLNKNKKMFIDWKKKVCTDSHASFTDHIEQKRDGGRSINKKVKINERLTASVMHCVWSWTVSRPDISPQSIHDNYITDKKSDNLSINVLCFSSLNHTSSLFRLMFIEALQQ